LAIFILTHTLKNSASNHRFFSVKTQSSLV
jgi:hypothetical protein